MLGRCCHHNLADAGGACEEDVMERQIEQRGGHAHIAFEQRHIALVKGFADNGGGDAGSGGAEVSQFDHATIASCNGCGNRTER